MMALPAENSFIHHLVILLMHDDLLSRPPLCPGLLPDQESVINDVPSKLHRLANTIWHLSLQDCIAFWEIMQKMNCRVETRRTEGSNTCVQKQALAREQIAQRTHTHAHTHTP